MLRIFIQNISRKISFVLINGLNNVTKYLSFSLHTLNLLLYNREGSFLVRIIAQNILDQENLDIYLMYLWLLC